MGLIFVVEDEPDILNLIVHHLNRSGFRAQGFQDARSFMDCLSTEIPDLVILDLMLPDMDGMEICRYMRSEDRLSAIPIIMLTARSGEEDRVAGLEMGADDYVVKPFSPRELVARVKAVLRRSGKKGRIKAGELLVDLDGHQVFVGGKRVDLTPTEFKILRMLVRKRGWVLTREKILDEVWGYDKVVLGRTVDVHIKNLREKLGDAGRFIKSVRGVGYKFEED